MNLLGQEKYTRDAVDKDTKHKILMEAIQLFALQGYHYVSMRNLAKTIGIKPASIYSHYKGKDELFEDVLLHVATWYRAYFERLSAANESVKSLEELMENLFMELMEVIDINVYYGISIIQQHKFIHKTAQILYYQLFHTESVEAIASYFDRLILQGKLLPFNTRALAGIFMNNVLTINELRIFEQINTEIDFDVNDFLSSLHELVYYSAKGIVPAAGN